MGIREDGTVSLDGPPGRAEPAAADRPASSPTYYDLPLLKPPVWKWEIASYFFFGGLSGGSLVLGRIAGGCAGRGGERLRRLGSLLALGTLAPCPLLLIKDLGDPARFPYMLRVFKPRSPMNLGSWGLSAFGATVGLAALLELPGLRHWRPLRKLVPVADAAIDLLGVPLGLFMCGYTGVLLSTSATPLWAKNDWLGPLFTSSALHTGAAALRLVAPDSRALRQVGQLTSLAEAGTLAGYLLSVGQQGAPLLRGRYAPHLWLGAVALGLALPELVERLPLPSRRWRRRARLVASALGLLGGYVLRWAILHAGRPSSLDPEAARRISRPAGG